jgi:DNA-binding transcriptional ArsR family regulator
MAKVKINPEVMKEQCFNVAQLMKTIAHPQRLMMLCYLADGEKNVSELIENCAISQSQVSQFLGRMHRERILEMRKEGNFVYYKIADSRLFQLIKSLQAIYC